MPLHTTNNKYLFCFSCLMKKILLFCLLFFLVSSCTDSGKTVVIHTATSDVSVDIEIADSAAEEAIGLMYRTSMEENHGMLFVFTDVSQRIFWMKNTKIPLDILFFDANGTLVDIKENFQPCTADPCEVYYSKPALSVLEVNAGFAERQGIVIGDSIS